MAKLLYQTALPYWLFATLSLKLVAAEVAYLTALSVKSVDTLHKSFVAAAERHSKAESTFEVERETHTEILELVVRRLGTYLGLRLELAPAPALLDRVQPQWYTLRYPALV